MNKKLFPYTLSLLALLASVLPVRAQWVSQSISLKAGWNAVYLHVDPSYDSLANLVGSDTNNPILEVWMWAPTPSAMQFVQSPQEPIVANSQWVNWLRTDNASSPLQRLAGNAAYLVKVATNVPAYTWTIKGKPLAPSYEWTTLGANFVGFPTATNNAPTFENFLAKCPELQQNAEIYYYPGGELGAGNPLRLFTARTTKVNRGQAYWIRSGTYFNRYFAPFDVVVSDAKGLAFGETLNACSFRLRNLTSTNLTVTLRLSASEAPPSGQAAFVGAPPLLVRGNLNTTNLTYVYTNLPLGGTRTWTLAAKGALGSEVEVVLGLNRAAMTDPAGSLRAGVLRLTDSLGYAQVEFPVSATMASSAGLWIGAAAVTQVGQYIKSYALNTTNSLQVGANGQYVVSGTNTSLGDVPSTFPLRLIVHNPASGNATLLQRIYVGVDEATNVIVASRESALNRTYLGASRRISAAHLPWTKENTPWSFDGSLTGSTTLTTIVTLDYADQESNPFLHTYHPDHDNLDSSFESVVARGRESYTVERIVMLNITPSAVDGSDFEAGDRTIKGTYAETITVLGLARAAQAGEALTAAEYTNKLAQYNAYVAYTNLYPAYTNQLAQYNTYVAYTNQLTQYIAYTNQLTKYVAYTNYLSARTRGVNGVFKLYVDDDFTLYSGTISNWSLMVETDVKMVTFIASSSTTNSIVIPAVGSASPYPSTNVVSGITNTVVGLRVQLNKFTHACPSDLDIFLVGGGRTNSTFLMSDVGGAIGVTNVTVTFSDLAPASMGPNETPTNYFVYRPTNGGFLESKPLGSVGNSYTNINALLGASVAEVASATAPQTVITNPGGSPPVIADPGPVPAVVPPTAKPWRSERTLEVRGVFSLTRITDVPVLTITP